MLGGALTLVPAILILLDPRNGPILIVLDIECQTRGCAITTSAHREADPIMYGGQGSNVHVDQELEQLLVVQRLEPRLKLVFAGFGRGVGEC